jgi:predicted phosphodiesterase
VATRLALFSDVHGDAEAVETALRRAAELGCAEIWCAGDLVEDGPDSAKVVQLLRAHDVVCVKGNHDRWVVQHDGCCNQDDLVDDKGGRTKRTEKLPPDYVAWLRDLPRSVERTIEGVSVGMWHAWPHASDMEFLFSDLPAWALQNASERGKVQVFYVGHTHSPCRIICPNGRVILNTGSLAQRVLWGEDKMSTPCTHGTFGILDLPSKKFTLYQLDGAEVPFVERVLY